MRWLRFTTWMLSYSKTDALEQFQDHGKFRAWLLRSEYRNYIYVYWFLYNSIPLSVSFCLSPNLCIYQLKNYLYDFNILTKQDVTPLVNRKTALTSSHLTDQNQSWSILITEHVSSNIKIFSGWSYIKSFAVNKYLHFNIFLNNTRRN